MRKDLEEAKNRIEAILNLSDEKILKLKNASGRLKELCRATKKVHQSIEMVGKLVKVKESSDWIYKGCTLEVLEVYMVQSGEYGVYEKGSMDLRLNLVGTKFEFSDVNGESRQSKTTVINTMDLILLDPTAK